MVKAIKVFVRLEMVLSAVLIWPLIWGAYVLYKLDSVEKREDLTNIGIASLFLFGIIPGILILCIKESDLNKCKINSERIAYNSFMWIVYSLVMSSVFWALLGYLFLWVNLFNDMVYGFLFASEKVYVDNIGDVLMIYYSWIAFELGFMILMASLNSRKKYSFANSVMLVFMMLVSIFSAVYSAMIYSYIVLELSVLLFVCSCIILLRFSNYKELNKVVVVPISCSIDTNNVVANKKVVNNNQNIKIDKDEQSDSFRKLSELKGLYDADIINEEEYIKLKKKLINNILDIK